MLFFKKYIHISNKLVEVLSFSCRKCRYYKIEYLSDPTFLHLLKHNHLTTLKSSPSSLILKKGKRKIKTSNTHMKTASLQRK